MHAAASFRGGLYVLGGYEGRGFCNDVWASTDGTRWSRLCHRAPWVPRRGHTVTATDDALVLVGGEGSGSGGGGESLGDCWTSQDGAAWSLVSFSLPRRHAHAACVVDGRLLVFGGAVTERRSDGDAKGTTSVVGDAFGIPMPEARASPGGGPA